MPNISTWQWINELRKNIVAGASNAVSNVAGTGTYLGAGILQYAGVTRWFSSQITAPNQYYDEKHTFLIPYRPTRYGYSVTSLRILPPDVAPVNDLPKRRYIHLPNLESEAMIRKILADQESQLATRLAQSEPQSPLGSSLNSLADHLDQIDSKMFYGALAIGSAVALINPVAGAVIAAKALAPSLLAMLAKAGLRQAGESLEQSAVEQRVQLAESQVLKQFHESNVFRIVNPMLARLSIALRTTDTDFDPLLTHWHPDIEEPLEIVGELDFARRDRLTRKAICQVYHLELGSDEYARSAGLGVEDLRWLKTLAQVELESDKGL